VRGWDGSMTLGSKTGMALSYSLSPHDPFRCVDPADDTQRVPGQPPIPAAIRSTGVNVGEHAVRAGQQDVEALACCLVGQCQGKMAFPTPVCPQIRTFRCWRTKPQVARS